VPDGRVLLVAGPGLPGAEQEIKLLADLHPAATVLSGADATAGQVGAALGDAALAHLACHGRLRADNPQFSALELHDGPLTVHELYGRGLAPHRVVLAACESAADTAYSGDELIGFVGALLARGTAGLLASTMLVPDAAAAPVMVALHRLLLQGRTTAESLHGARDLLGTDDPALLPVWCGFTAYGAA
jgi:CHAT domain-containing protein